MYLCTVKPAYYQWSQGLAVLSTVWATCLTWSLSQQLQSKYGMAKCDAGTEALDPIFQFMCHGLETLKHTEP